MKKTTKTLLAGIVAGFYSWVQTLFHKLEIL